MKTRLLVIACSTAIAAGAMIAGPSRAADETALAQRSGCLACHKGAENRIGPPYKEVAAKYAGQKNAAAALADRIVKGTGPDGVGWMAAGKATLPSMPPNGNVSPGNAMKLAKWVLGIKGEIAGSSRFVTEKMTVTGLVKNPLTLTVDDLRQFSPRHVGELPIVCQSGANLGKLENLGGVLLRNILDKAGIVSRSHNDFKKMAIIATASDDYKVVFSWSEVFNSPAGEEVIVFYERDGQPLGDDEGRIALVSAHDIRTGPRHVKWLKAIEVRKIVD
jgi:cytochrome c551/c552